MTSLNEAINSKRENVTSVIKKMKDGDYFVDQSFQRKLIWTESQKVRLIETILMGYPMPEIYLWAQKSDPDSGNQLFSIVDGQQRLTSIRQFIAGEWALKKAAMHKDNGEQSYVGKYWKDLSPELKSSVWEYNINVREIPSEITEAKIHKIFLRLNQTDKSLNPQEMRNAEFHGEFINAAVTLANAINKKNWKIFSDNDIRRMKDIEFSGQLLSYLLKGITGHTSSSLNELYDTYNDVYEKKKPIHRKAIAILTQIEELFQNQSVKTFFSKPVHFFTIFAVLDISKATKSPVQIESLLRFVETYQKQDFEDPRTDKVFMEYKRGSSSTTAGKASRERRIFSLVDYLEG